MRENRRTAVGWVVSDKMNKTVVVEIRTRKPHPLYRRILNRTTRFKAHDEHDRCNLGDLVRIIESRPISKEKHWQVAQILTRGHVAQVQPQEIGQTEVEEVLPGRAEVSIGAATEGEAEETGGTGR